LFVCGRKAKSVLWQLFTNLHIEGRHDCCVEKVLIFNELKHADFFRLVIRKIFQ